MNISRNLASLLTSLALCTGMASAQIPAPGVLPTPEIPADTEKVTMPSGLVYSVLQEGDGSASPVFGDRVKVHYSGWLTNGTLFDSSRQRGEPAEFAVGRVIEGWNEALGLMSPGSRLKLTIPANLAYGEEGRPSIPANSTLIFDVELIAVTARTLAFQPWTAELAKTLPCTGTTCAAQDGSGEKLAPGQHDHGVTYCVLQEGTGTPCAGADAISLAFAMYGEDNKPILSSAMEGAPLLGNPAQMPLPFLGGAVALARQGTRMNIQVPYAQMTRLAGMPGVEEGKTYLWQIEILSSMSFNKPAFVLPADEELTTTASGLKYKVVREGAGTKPTAANEVVAHYAGWLTDGTPFDNSYDRGQPSTFPLSRVIGGWTEGLQLMAPGAMVIFVIPSDLGYGPSGSPPTIPGGATLVFAVELVDVR